MPPGEGVKWPAWARINADEPAAQRGKLSAETDSLAAAADYVLDSLAVSPDSLETMRSLGDGIPDISDSLAAATAARLPGSEELFDYPVVINRRVLTWVDLFLGKTRKMFERSLQRSGRYVGMARRIFAEEGVPQDLVFLAHVESAFRHNALSRARALGLWQFMRGTAALYGLRCDTYVDERLDPEKETRAAACHLRDLYEIYHDWYLALAAYNAGAGKVNRAIERAGTRDFWSLATTRYLQNETRDFVPAILAATILAKSPGAYGLTEETDPPLTYETIKVDTPTDLRVIAKASGATLTELRALNPALLMQQTPQRSSAYEVRLPVGLGERCLQTLAQIPASERISTQRHRVVRGETLGQLARRYGSSVKAIQDANRLGRSTLIHVGQSLVIPGRHFVADEETPAKVAMGEGQSLRHRVSRGETLARIASRYGCSTQAIAQANHLANPNRLGVGQSLVIPKSPAQTASADSDEETAEREESASPSAAAPLASSEPMPDDAQPESEDESDMPAAVEHPSMLLALNTSSSLGRVATTAHIVERARQEVLSEPEPVPVLAAAPAPQETAPAARHHYVRRGETLSEIARKYGTDVSSVRRWNNLKKSKPIFPGQKLLVAAPPEGVKDRTEKHRAADLVHVVRRGESLWKIAQRYGVRMSDLVEWNRLSRGAKIYPGQKILIYH